MTKEEREYYLDIYKKERELLFNSKLEQSKMFDKYIFTISAAALGLSLTLIKDVFKNPEWNFLLALSWLFFIISVLCSLISFHLSQKVIDEHLEILNEYINFLFNHKEEEFENKGVKFSKLLEFTNLISFFSLVLGLLILFVFYIRNI